MGDGIEDFETLRTVHGPFNDLQCFPAMPLWPRVYDRNISIRVIDVAEAD